MPDTLAWIAFDRQGGQMVGKCHLRGEGPNGGGWELDVAAWDDFNRLWEPLVSYSGFRYENPDNMRMEMETAVYLMQPDDLEYQDWTICAISPDTEKSLGVESPQTARKATLKEINAALLDELTRLDDVVTARNAQVVEIDELRRLSEEKSRRLELRVDELEDEVARLEGLPAGKKVDAAARLAEEGFDTPGLAEDDLDAPKPVASPTVGGIGGVARQPRLR